MNGYGYRGVGMPGRAPMAGRGRAATMPAWMTKKLAEDNAKAQAQAIASNVAASGPQGHAPVAAGAGAPPQSSRRSRSKSGSRDRRRRRSSRRSGSRSRSRSRSRRHRSRRRHHSRSRSRSRSHRRRRSKHRSGSRRRSKSRSRRRSRSRRSGSRSRSPARRRRRKSGFDVTPDAAAANPMMSAPYGQMPQFGGVPGAMPMAPMGMAAAGGQATRHARRLYVGGAPPGTTEEHLRAFFQEQVERGTGDKGVHVVNVYLNHERRFAFVEFRSIPLATACLALDGVEMGGNQLRVRRPNDYNPAAVPPVSTPPIKLNLGKLDVVSNMVPDGPGKIFVGGLPYDLTETQVRELLEAFGKLKGLHLVSEPGMDHSKGYAFCEYADHSVTDVACQGLNGLAVGDKTLTVRRAMPRGGMGGGGGGMGGAASGSNMAPMMMGMHPALVPNPLAAYQPKRPQTPVIMLTNMVSASDVADDAEYADILDDVRQECAKFGNVRSVSIPRAGSAVGKVFVEFSSPEEGGVASKALAGRTFGPNTVGVEFIPPELYSARKFDEAATLA